MSNAAATIPAAILNPTRSASVSIQPASTRDTSQRASPFSPRISARLSAGIPHSVHRVQNAGSPVKPSPLGRRPRCGGRDDRGAALENLLEARV